MTTNIVINIVIQVLIFLSGLIIGNRLAIGRDRRKEYNIIAEKIRLGLIKEKEYIIEGNMAIEGTEDTDFKKLMFQLSWYKLRRFNNLLSEYKEIKKKEHYNNKYGGSFYHDSIPVLSSINKLLKFTKLK